MLPGLLIRSQMIHRAHYRGEAHRRNNANKPITSILRNRRARQQRGSEGGRGGGGSELRGLADEHGVSFFEFLALLEILVVNALEAVLVLKLLDLALKTVLLLNLLNINKNL